MSRRTKARWVGVLALLVVGAGAWLLRPTQSVTAGDELLVRAGRFAPPTAISVSHFNVKRIAESIGAMLDGNQVFELEKHEAPLTVLGKINSMDAYQLGTGDEPNPLIAFYGNFGPEDIAVLERAASDTGAVRIQKGLNGRCQVHLKGDSPFIVSIGHTSGAVREFVLILGDEADDVPGGMVLAGLPGALTPELLKTLGKASNKTLQVLLKGLDPSADACVAMDARAIKDEIGFLSIKGSLFFLTEGRSNVEVLFDSPEAARKVTKEIAEFPFISKLLQELVDFEVKGDRLAITWETSDKLMAELGRKRALAKRQGSMSCLNGIGKSIAIYVNDGVNDAWPPDLEALVKAKQPPKLFVSPSSGRRSPYDAKGKFRSDYIYIKGMPRSGPKYLIAVYEPPELNNFEQVLTLHYNLSVSMLKPGEFKREIEKTAKWLGENGTKLTLDPKTREWLKTVRRAPEKR